MRRCASLSLFVLLAFVCASPASAQLVAAKDGPIVYGHHHLNASNTDEAKKFLIDHGFDPNYGARPLQRTIQRWIEDPLAEDILLKKFESGAVIHVDVESSGEKLSFSPKPAVAKVK